MKEKIIATEEKLKELLKEEDLLDESLKSNEKAHREYEISLSRKTNINRKIYKLRKILENVNQISGNEELRSIVRKLHEYSENEKYLWFKYIEANFVILGHKSLKPELHLKFLYDHFYSENFDMIKEKIEEVTNKMMKNYCISTKEGWNPQTQTKQWVEISFTLIDKE